MPQQGASPQRDASTAQWTRVTKIRKTCSPGPVVYLRERSHSVLPHGHPGMRRIDLTCLILAPIGVGFLMTYAGARAAIVATLAWNLIAWRPECLLAAHAVLCSDALQCAQPAPGCMCMRGSLQCTGVCAAKHSLHCLGNRMLMSGWQERLWAVPAVTDAALLSPELLRLA